MAAKKKTARKSTARKKGGSRKQAGAKQRGTKLLKSIDKELASLSKTLDKNLAPLRKEIEKAERQAGSQGARVLREARKRLNKLELKGHSDLTKFMKARRRDLSGALSDLERTVRPKRKKVAKKKTARKKAARKKA